MSAAVFPIDFTLLQRFAPVIIAFIVFYVIFELTRIPKRLKEKAAFEHLSGRAEGTVTNYRKERILRYRSTDPEQNDSYEYLTIISYQFEVNGQVYYGEGEGSGAFWERHKQTICYDPNDPDDNCTLYYLNSKTKSHFLKTLLFFIGMLVFLYIAIVVFAKLRK